MAFNICLYSWRNPSRFVRITLDGKDSSGVKYEMYIDKAFLEAKFSHGRGMLALLKHTLSEAIGSLGHIG